ncbi:MAG: dihydrofolate reductase family protein, partial [Chloroflexota bacterium]|nr:dihydrofolate reductase family protein [Chloroflexota bacterium]
QIIIYCHKKPDNYESGGNITFVEIRKKDGTLDLTMILKDLSDRGCINVLMEGGGKLLGSLIDLNLVNKVRLFISPMLIGGESSTDSIGGDGIEFISQSKKLTDIEVKIIESDIMVTGLIKDHV